MHGDWRQERDRIAEARLLSRLAIGGPKSRFRDELLLGEEVFVANDPRDASARIYNTLEVSTKGVVLVDANRTAQVEAIAPVELLLSECAKNDVFRRGLANGKRLRGTVE